MRALLVMVCLSACAGGQLTTAAVHQAVTALGGDEQAGSCNNAAECEHYGGGTGSMVLPLVAIGAIVVIVAGVTYVYSIVQQPARVTTSARNP
jgi:hypothetical protein